MQANDAEGRKERSIEEGKRRKEKEREGKRRKGLTRANTAIYSKKKGGSCLNRKANGVSSGQGPGII